MDVATHCDHLAREGERLAAIADRLDGPARAKTVVTCPDGDVAELFRHVGGLYRWSAHLVAETIGTETWRSSLPIEYPHGGDDFAAWLRAGLTPALETFRTAGPTARVWVWGADPHARHWPRRMLFETVVHRCDAELTLDGTATPIDPLVAVDGIDEFLENLPYTARWNAGIAELRADEPWTVGFRASDTGDAWRVRVEANGWFWERDADDADAVVDATAHDLVLWLQGRPVSVAVSGDGAKLERWRAATVF
jgi:uncharacterized protein (TIGR03083 family)